MGRSGSTYVSRYLNLLGLSNLHETDQSWPFSSPATIAEIEECPAVVSGYQGIVGWQWPFKAPKLIARLEHIFFLTRHPLSAIPSATVHSDGVLNYLENALGVSSPNGGEPGGEGDRLRRCANIWLAYAAGFAPSAVHLRVEDFHCKGESLSQFLASLEIPPAVGKVGVDLGEQVNSRRHLYPTAFSDPIYVREVVGEEIWTRLDSQASRFGYEINDG